MSKLEMVMKNLNVLAKCRRCSCLSCERAGAGELHDHVCTQGDHCVDTREKMLRRLYALATVAGQARTMIKQLVRERDALQPKPSDVVLEDGEVSEAMAEEAGRALARGVRMAWDGLAPARLVLNSQPGGAAATRTPIRATMSSWDARSWKRRFEPDARRADVPLLSIISE